MLIEVLLLNLDGFSMRPLTVELSDALVGGRIDKISQQSKSSITMSVRQPGKNFLLQISLNPQNPSARIISQPLENLPEPPAFCMLLRKKLESGRIAQIKQHELDRLIFIEVDTLGASNKIETTTLALELMGKYSNIILIENGIIVDALKKIGTNISRVRTVLPNQPYQLPPAQNKLDIFSTPIVDIVTRIKSEASLRLDKAIMNTCQGFGPVTTKEVIFTAGLKNTLQVEEVENFETLQTALIKIREACANPSPCFITDSNKKILAVSSFIISYLSVDNNTNSQQSVTLNTFDTISQMLETADSLIGSYVPPDKERFNKLVHNELKRATNKITVLQKELDEADNADKWRIYADNLLTYQYNFKDHADDEIEVIDIYSEDGNLLKIPLDRRVTIAANVQSFYKKYDKLKRSKAYITQQIQNCRDEINYLESVEHSLIASTTLSDINEIKMELIAGRYLKDERKKTATSKKAEPFIFKAEDGSEIIVGKNNYQNDRLRKGAAPDDVWLHTKDIPGSHVILKTGGLEPSEQTLIEAAKIAARFSQAQDSSNVPVDYTLCRYVKKPNGSKPGFVIFTNQHTLYVTP